MWIEEKEMSGEANAQRVRAQHNHERSRGCHCQGRSVDDARGSWACGRTHPVYVRDAVPTREFWRVKTSAVIQLVVPADRPRITWRWNDALTGTPIGCHSYLPSTNK
jgi:hypothetical protein